MSNHDAAAPHLARLTDHARKNRAMWDRNSDEYEERHAGDLAGARAMA